MDTKYRGLSSHSLERGAINFSRNVTSRAIARMVKALEDQRKFKSLDPIAKLEMIEIAKSFLFSVSFDTLVTLEKNKMLDSKKLEEYLESVNPGNNRTHK